MKVKSFFLLSADYILPSEKKLPKNAQKKLLSNMKTEKPRFKV